MLQHYFFTGNSQLAIGHRVIEHEAILHGTCLDGHFLVSVAQEANLEGHAHGYKWGKKIFLETFVKVEPDWRKKVVKLKRFGYKN